MPSIKLPVACALAALVLAATPARAQVTELGVGAGVAAPVYEAAQLREPGPHLLGYVGYALSPRVTLRGELRLARLSESPEPASGTPNLDARGDVGVAGAGATLVWHATGTRASGVYALAGAGLYTLRATGEGVPGPDGLVPGMNLGLGASLDAGGVGLFAETRVEVPFSSFGTGTESAPLMFLPLAVGVRLPCCGSSPSRP